MGSDSLDGVCSKPAAAWLERPSTAIIRMSEDEGAMTSSRALDSVGAARAADEDETASVAKISDELVDESLMTSAGQQSRCSLWW